MNAPGGPAVPYPGEAGPRRVLELTLHSSHATRELSPTVVIDGEEHVCAWGACRFEVPRDHPVRVEIFVPALDQVGSAVTVVQPGQVPVLRYRAPEHPAGLAGDAASGAPQPRGRGPLVAALFLVLFVLLVTFGVVVFLIVR